LVYIVNDEAAFTGDVGGIRLAGLRHLRLPTPPPEFNPVLWRQTIIRLRQERFSRVVPTHYGIYMDRDWHMDALERALDDIEAWMETVMPAKPAIDLLRQQYLNHMLARSRQDALDPAQQEAQENANPSFMSADGLWRYWNKVRTTT
jgi:hypothetical protein